MPLWNWRIPELTRWPSIHYSFQRVAVFLSIIQNYFSNSHCTRKRGNLNRSKNGISSPLDIAIYLLHWSGRKGMNVLLVCFVSDGSLPAYFSSSWKEALGINQDFSLFLFETRVFSGIMRRGVWSTVSYFWIIGKESFFFFPFWGKNRV